MNWYTGSCGGNLIENGSPITVFPVSTTTYYVSCEDDYCESECVSVSVTVNPIPTQAGTPAGLDAVCANSEDTDYTTSGATNASNYVWSISPAGAGTISGTGTTGTVNWNNAYLGGTATITVTGTNTCGTGPVSEGFAVVVTGLPTQAGTPAGLDAVCANSEDTDYTTSGATNASNYVWSISPPGAGTISGTGTTGTVNWNNAYLGGTATITVTGTNTCGTGPVSEGFAVVVTGLPTQAGTPAGLDAVCANSEDTDYTTSGATNASNYVWSISSAGAGTISGTGTTGTVNWNNAYLGGTATITVTGTNTCGTESRFRGFRSSGNRATNPGRNTSRIGCSMCKFRGYRLHNKWSYQCL
ncbi:MAG: hypothetical protein R2764_17120 [Bacteroidales bacterium]